MFKSTDGAANRITINASINCTAKKSKRNSEEIKLQQYIKKKKGKN
jgi:hypothetical protein